METGKKKLSHFSKSSSFGVFCQKPEQKVRFQREIEQKPNIIHRQFPSNVTFFMRGTLSLFYCFCQQKKRPKGEISERI